MPLLAQNQSSSGKGEKRRGPPPKEAIEICKAEQENASCAFTDTRRNKEITGTCRIVPDGTKACVPERRSKPKKTNLLIAPFSI